MTLRPKPPSPRAPPATPDSFPRDTLTPQAWDYGPPATVKENNVGRAYGRSSSANLVIEDSGGWYGARHLKP